MHDDGKLQTPRAGGSACHRTQRERLKWLPGAGSKTITLCKDTPLVIPSRTMISSFGLVARVRGIAHAPVSRPCADPPSLMGSAALFLEAASDYFAYVGDMRAWGRRKTG